MKKFVKVICYIFAGGFLITLGYFAEKIVNGTLGDLTPEEKNNALSPDRAVTVTLDQGAVNLLTLIKNASSEMYNPEYDTCLEINKNMLFVHRRTIEKEIEIQTPYIDVVDEVSGMNAREISTPRGFKPVESAIDFTAYRNYTDTNEILSTSENVEGYTLVCKYGWNPLDAIFAYSKGEGESFEVILLNAYLYEHSAEFLSADWKYEGIATYELAQRLGVAMTPDLDLNNSGSISIPLGLN